MYSYVDPTGAIVTVNYTVRQEMTMMTCDHHPY